MNYIWGFLGAVEGVWADEDRGQSWAWTYDWREDWPQGRHWMMLTVGGKETREGIIRIDQLGEDKVWAEWTVWRRRGELKLGERERREAWCLSCALGAWGMEAAHRDGMWVEKSLKSHISWLIPTLYLWTICSWSLSFLMGGSPQLLGFHCFKRCLPFMLSSFRKPSEYIAAFLELSALVVKLHWQIFLHMDFPGFLTPDGRRFRRTCPCARLHRCSHPGAVPAPPRWHYWWLPQGQGEDQDFGLHWCAPADQGRLLWDLSSRSRMNFDLIRDLGWDAYGTGEPQEVLRKREMGHG